MNRRTVLATAFALASLVGCYYGQYFDVSWDEEVKLHDGRVIVVKLKFYNERLDRLSKYGRTILRDTELTFDAGPPRGRVTQLFKRVKPVMLDQVDGTWYVVLQGRAGSDSPRISGQDWGSMQNFNGDRVARLGQAGFEPISMHALPPQLQQKNLLHDYAPDEELATFEGTLVDLRKKEAYSAKYPPHPEDAKLLRPNAASTPAQAK
jgi:hypothetical protein